MKSPSRLPYLAAACTAVCLAFAAAPAWAAGPVVAARWDGDHRGHNEGHDRGHDRDRGQDRDDRGRGHAERGHWDRDRGDRHDWHGPPRYDHDGGAGLGALFGALSLALAPPLRPVYVAPPPRITYYAPYGRVSAVPASPVYRTADGRYCREYDATVRIGGRLQPAYGTACLASDGAWHIAN